MGKNSKEKDDKKTTKTSASKSNKAHKKSLRSAKRSVHGMCVNNLSTCASSIDQCLGTASTCYNLLNDMCVHATLFQRHSHRDKLLASDIRKASDLYLLMKQSNVIIEKRNNIQLSSCIDKSIDVKAAEKTFYYGKCLNRLALTDIGDDSGQCLKDYFEFTMKAVLVNNSDLFSLLLSDLKKNLNILEVLPVFIHSVCNDNFLHQHKPAHLKKFLLVIHSLYLNPNLYFQNEYLHKILDFIIACAVKNFVSQNHQPEDIFSLQDTCAEILHDIFLENHSLSSQVYNFILTKLAVPYNGTKFELISCCGSLTIVNVMNLSAVAFILPLIFLNSSRKEQDFLSILAQELSSKNVCTKTYSRMINRKLFEASQHFLKYSLYRALALPEICELYKLESSNQDKIFKNKTNAPTLNVRLCCSILKYYGETITSCLPSLLNASDEVVPVKVVFEMLQKKECEEVMELKRY